MSERFSSHQKHSPSILLIFNYIYLPKSLQAFQDNKHGLPKYFAA